MDKEKLIKLIEEIKCINFAYVSDRNPFDWDEQNKIVCYQIDLIVERSLDED